MSNRTKLLPCLDRSCCFHVASYFPPGGFLFQDSRKDSQFGQSEVIPAWSSMRNLRLCKSLRRERMLQNKLDSVNARDTVKMDQLREERLSSRVSRDSQDPIKRPRGLAGHFSIDPRPTKPAWLPRCQRKRTKTTNDCSSPPGAIPRAGKPSWERAVSGCAAWWPFASISGSRGESIPRTSSRTPTSRPGRIWARISGSPRCHFSSG